MILGIMVLSLCLTHTPPQVYDTRDITQEIPKFDNAPRFNLNRGIRGENPVGRPERKNRQPNKESLQKLLNELYGDRFIIFNFNGVTIIKERNDKASMKGKDIAYDSSRKSRHSSRGHRFSRNRRHRSTR